MSRSDSDDIAEMALIGIPCFVVLSAIGASIGVDWITAGKMIFAFVIVAAVIWYTSYIYNFRTHWPIIIPGFYLILTPALEFWSNDTGAWYGQRGWMMFYFSILCIVALIMILNKKKKYPGYY